MGSRVLTISARIASAPSTSAEVSPLASVPFSASSGTETSTALPSWDGIGTIGEPATR